MKEPTTNRWAVATVVAGLATSSLTLVYILAERRRIEIASTDALEFAILCGVLLTLGLAVPAWARPPRAEGRDYARWLALLYAAGTVAFVVAAPKRIPSVQTVREITPQSINFNNLRQIVLALHNYAGANSDTLPGPGYCTPDGKPLLSWRVVILPYLEQDILYREFHLNEPWDSPHNIKLLPRMPRVYDYLNPRTRAPAGHTHWLAFVGPGTAMERKRVRLPDDFPDGLSQTIGVIDAATAVPWTKPDDLPFDPAGPPPALGASAGDPRRVRMLVGMMDGTVRRLDRGISWPTLRAAVTRNGGEKFGRDW